MRKPSASARRSDRAGPVPAAPSDRSRSRATVRAGKSPIRADRSPARTARPLPARQARAERRATERLVQARKASPTADPGAAASRGTYAYCSIEAVDPLRFGPIGSGAEPSEGYTVHYKTLAAAGSHVRLDETD